MSHTAKTLPPQHQDRQPGKEKLMRPQPEDTMEHYRGNARLAGQVAVITGGDSGIGRAVSIAFAKEGANVAVIYLEESEDAARTKQLVEAAGQQCLLLKGDIGRESFCKRAIEKTLAHFGRLDILVNNSGEQHPQSTIEDIEKSQLERTFSTNIFSMFHLTKAAYKHLKNGGRIINTASVTAYRGSPELIDYSATKGAIVSFTRSLSGSAIKDGIRVNAVAPGPIWTPLIPSSFDTEKVEHFGSNTAMERAGQPDEVAPAYVFLASDDSSYFTGQVLHPNGGAVVNG